MSKVQGERKVPVRLTGQSDVLCWTWGSHNVQGTIWCCCVLKTEPCFISRPKAPRNLSFIGRDSSGGIANRYWQDGLGIDCR